MHSWTVLSGLLVAVASSDTSPRPLQDSPAELRSLTEATRHYGRYFHTDIVVRSEPERPKFRILCLGDSITVGFLSDNDDGDGNGYRLELRDKVEGMMQPRISGGYDEC